MNNKKQSSIDYAVEKLEKLIPPGNQIIIHLILEQAKAMHKEEISNAFSYFGDEYVDEKHCEEYYNETYGGNNE